MGSTPAPAPIASPTPAPTTSPTPLATPTATFLTAEYDRSTGPAQHNAITAWTQGYNGKGVTIGIVDTGIDTANPEFAGRISSASTDVAGNRGLIPEDDHGTDVSLVAAAARNNTGVMGIAFDATIAMFRADTPGSCATYDPKVPSSGCSFADSDIARGVDDAVAAGAKVINLSLGGGSPSLVLTNAVQRAAAAGVVVVVSAGNDGASTDPSVDPNNPDPFASGLQAVGNGNVIIAGSVDQNNVISSFSNRAGSEANWYLAARGERVCCVYQNGVLKVVTNPDGTQSVYVFSGTSFSAPQIAGAAALLRQAFPNLTGAQVVDLLLKSAKDAGAVGIDPVYGRGILDIAAAFAPQGTTTLAGSTTAVTLGGTTVITSASMGDAIQAGQSLSTVVLDSYQRAYSYNFGSGFSAARLQPKLAPALAAQTRNLSLGSDRLAMAFTVDARDRVDRLPWSGQLRLSRADAEQARVLAARVVARIAPRAEFGFALNQGADGLVAQLQGRRQPAFLVAGSPLDDFGFGQSGEASLAVRYSLGRWGLTASAEGGSAIAAAPVDPGSSIAEQQGQAHARRFGLALDRRIGNLSATLGASWLAEDRSVLGARLVSALGGGGADSLFLDAGASWQLAPDWRLGAAWRSGITHARASGTIVGSHLLTSAWALDVERLGVFARDDSLALRVAQPLRVENGGLSFALPIAYSYDTLAVTQGLRTLSLAPHGREIDTELAWRGALAKGTASASLFYRRDPGHYASMPDDKGVAVGWTKQF